MTVAEIKKYIQNSKVKIDNMLPPNAKKKTDEVLREVLSMLDELEQPIEIDTEKYFEQIDKLVDKKMAQHLKDQMKKALKKEIEKGE